MEHATGFDKSACRLPEARLEVWEGFMFVNLDPDAAPLAPQLATLSRKLAGYSLSEMRTAAFVDYESDWNWKVMMENALESYHHAGIHRDTLEPLFPARYTSHEDVDGPYVYHHIPTRDRVHVPAQFPVPDDLPDEQRRELLVVGVFPDSAHRAPAGRDELLLRHTDRPPASPRALLFLCASGGVRRSRIRD